MCVAGLAGDGRAEFYSLCKRLVLGEESGMTGKLRETGEGDGMLWKMFVRGRCFQGRDMVCYLIEYTYVAVNGGCSH